ncbi:MAG: homoserine dehydrogenase [Erysipelotrichaceae bacterium]|nr:homoserine dehydrogenase [Erysipelotrichaceae bacterium]
MNAVLLGYGTIGKGVEDLARNVEGLNLTNVFVLPEFVDEPYFTNDGLGLVTDPNTDIVFECLSGTEPANELIRAALKAGKHVITSNKAVVSPNLKDYVDLARENGGSIQIEAAVAGGIPFLDALLKLSLLEELDGYEGIFNGTSNYILDNMQKEGTPYEEALKQAQALGYAEFNPAADVEGWDVFYKSNIANALAYKTYFDKIRNPLGISRLSLDDIAKAKKEGRVIRHVSKSVQKDGEFDTVIAPVFLEKEDYLANIPSNYNAQLIYAPSFSKLGYFGQGAGRYATAQAMLANAIDTLQNTERVIELQQNKTYNPTLIKENWIVRSKKDLSGLEGFEKSEAVNERENYYFFNGRNSMLIDEVLAADPDAMIAVWR